MAEELLVKEFLSSEMISAGYELAKYLHNSQIATDALLWLYNPEANVWRFIVASPEVSGLGPKKVYEKVRSILMNIPEDQRKVSLADIFVVKSNDPLISPLRTAINTGQNIKGIRLFQNVISGVFIDDVYIYKLT